MIAAISFRSMPAVFVPAISLFAGQVAAPATAQDGRAAERIEDLIPDEAVSDPDAWARQGVDEEALLENAQDTAAQPVPSVSVPNLEQVDIVAPDPLPALEDGGAANDIDAPFLIEPTTFVRFEVSRGLQLGFPSEFARLPQTLEIIERIADLSAISAASQDDGIEQQILRQARSDKNLIENVMRTYGYYDAQVIRQVGAAANEAGNSSRTARARFDVLPGQRFRIGSITLGDIDSAPDSEQLRKAFSIEPGDALSADRISVQRAILVEAIAELGYPFAEVGEPQLLVDHALGTGDLSLGVKPNGKYVLGQLVSNAPEFLSSDHLGRLARFSSGDTFKGSLANDLRQAIAATGLVTSVEVTPRETVAPTGSVPGTVALDVDLEPARLRTVAGALGYGSEDGFKLEGRWEHRNLFPPEGALTIRGVLGTREQLGSLSFKRSNFGGRDRVLTVAAYASNIETDAVEARTIALGATYERLSNFLFQKQLSWSLGGELLATEERNVTPATANLPRQRYHIGGLQARITWDETDDLLDPSSGHRLTAVFAPDLSNSNSTTSVYAKTGVEARVYRSVGTTVIAGRANVASINGADLMQIAPSRRLYAGGGSSIRGYGFQAVGPRDAAGVPVGGRSLAEFSLEARIETGLLDGALEIVPFVDAGSVSQDPWPDLSETRFGAGIGVRYKTSFGPIRVDVGAPLNPTAFDSPVAVYVSLGQAF